MISGANPDRATLNARPVVCPVPIQSVVPYLIVPTVHGSRWRNGRDLAATALRQDLAVRIKLSEWGQIPFFKWSLTPSQFPVSVPGSEHQIQTTEQI